MRLAQADTTDNVKKKDLLVTRLVETLDRFGPFLLVAPATPVIVGLGTYVYVGAVLAALVTAVVALAWVMLLGIVATRLVHRDRWGPTLANASVLLALTVVAVQIGGGTVYTLMMRAGLSDPASLPTVLQVAGAATGFYIVIGILREWLMLPAAGS